MKNRGDFASNPRLIPLSLIAMIIGAVCAGVAMLLLSMIAFFTNLFYFQRFSLEASSPAGNLLGLAAIGIPVLGGLIIGLMARYGSERIRGHGIPEALEAILYGKSIMQPKVAVLKPLSSAISIGSGGPFGAEGPIIMTGGAFGSIFAQIFHLSAAERKTLLVAGAAAGMAATFDAPIASVLLSVELLLFEWRPRSLVPVALASAVAAAIRPLLLGSGPLFPIVAHPPVPLLGLLAAVPVGLAAGIFSTVVSGALYKVEDAFEHLPIHWMWRPALGGLIVGIGGYFQPRALGVGYDVIADLLKGNLAPGAVAALISTKGAIWMIALASGTSGGVLAPLLIMGCGLGALESAVLPASGVSLWPLISMSAVLGGMMRVPFTAVIFGLELTHDINALAPALIAAVIAYAFTVLAMKRSILTEKVARRGFDVFREYGVDPLERVRIEEVMSTTVVTIPADTPALQLTGRFFSGRPKHRGYPVVGPAGELVGLLTGSDLLAIPGLEVPDEVRAEDLIHSEAVVIAYPGESCRTAAERMASAQVGRLPVVSPQNPKVLVGIITRSDLLKPRFLQHEEEQRHERIIRVRVPRPVPAGRPD